jgi:hypothetical protein
LAITSNLPRTNATKRATLIRFSAESKLVTVLLPKLVIPTRTLVSVRIFNCPKIGTKFFRLGKYSANVLNKGPSKFYGVKNSMQSGENFFFIIN